MQLDIIELLLVNRLIVCVWPPACNHVDDYDHGDHKDNAREHNHRNYPVWPARVELAVAIRWLEEVRKSSGRGEPKAEPVAYRVNGGKLFCD